MMEFILYAVIILVVMYGGNKMLDALAAKNKTAISGPKLSEVSKQLKKEYEALPVDSRPFPDITSILVNLDEVTSGDPVERRRHFDANWYENIQTRSGGFRFDWQPNYHRCTNHHRCEYRAYWELHNTILEVKKAIDEKEKALRQAKFDQDGLLELQQRLRDEAGIQKQIAKELS